MNVNRTPPDQVMFSERCPTCGSTVKIFITGDPEFQRCWECRSLAAYRALRERLGHVAGRLSE